MRDPFSILGIPSHSDEATVVRAFRTHVRELHPDRRPDDPDAHDRFIELLHAFDAARKIASGGRSARPVQRPVRMRCRFVCPRCDDSFPMPESCPRCAVPLRDRRARSAPVPDVDPRVEAMEARLLAPSRPPIPWLDPDGLELPMIVSVAAATLGVFQMSIGLAPMGVLLLGAATVLGAGAIRGRGPFTLAAAG